MTSSPTLPDLPIEILSHIISLIAPAFYPLNPITQPELDPVPPPPRVPSEDISAISKASHKLLEASRPWLWENVDVRSGRGWLAIVDALTEEVIEHPPAVTGVSGTVAVGDVEGTASATSTPVPPQEAHRAPMMLGGVNRYISLPASTSYPDPYPIATSSSNTGIRIGIPARAGYSYSPPQPPHLSMLLTPPGSRGASPYPTQTFPPSPTLVSNAKSKLRGRSRSPRRSIGFDTEGISAVLERSRSGSSHHTTPPGLHRTTSSRSGSIGGQPHMNRRSSLSRSRTHHDMEDEDMEDEDAENEDQDAEEDEAHDELAPLSPRTSILSSFSPSVPEDSRNVNPELLPPPGPYIRHLSFNSFRTIGSRRTQDEAVRGRFVTAGRLEGVLKNAPNLISLCMTEYVDSSLSFPVLEELFFRGYRRPRRKRRHSASLSRARSLSVGLAIPPSPATSISQLDPPRPVYVPYEEETEDDTWTRRTMFTPLEALDMTGCVSRAFTEGMAEFWETFYGDGSGSEERGRSRRRHGDSSTEDEDRPSSTSERSRSVSRHLTFSAMRRLSLRACTSLDPPIIQSLVLSMSNLTHLDLSNTRVPSSLFLALTTHCSSSFRLESLSLARCARLDPAVVVDFLVHSPAAHGLLELNLYKSPVQGNSLSRNDVKNLLTAPCIQSGKLRYLDISCSALDAGLLHPDHFPPQPQLVSLGLSNIPHLGLSDIAFFLECYAPNVEILTLTGTAVSSLNPAYSSLQIALEIHARLINPLTTVPFSLSAISLSPDNNPLPDTRPGPTRLRVIELSAPIRRALFQGGNADWKVVKSKGGRGWYVDVSAHWITVDSERQFIRHLPKFDERRKWVEGLADANGRVASSVGWHSRKMEVIKGWGMLGREGGMAGVGAFAFEE